MLGFYTFDRIQNQNQNQMNELAVTPIFNRWRIDRLSLTKERCIQTKQTKIQSNCICFAITFVLIL